MYGKIHFALPLLSLLLLYATSIQAQDASSTTVAPALDNPQLCNETDAMDFDAQKMAGIWWEVARNPEPSALLCVEVNFTVLANDEISIGTIYSNTPSYPYVNQTMTTSISYNSSKSYSDGFNISYVNGLMNTSFTVFKLLDTDYNNYALVCGYTNATNNATSFGLVLTRQRNPKTALLDSYEEIATKNFSNFLNGSMYLITQDATCYSGAEVTAPFTLLYAVFACLVVIMRNFKA